jgi:hypothetical protein
MKSVVAVLLGVVGLSVSAHGQAVMRILVSTDGGATWGSSAFSSPGAHVDVLITVSYTGSNASIAGFGSANFQPIIYGWDNTGAGTRIDRLSPILQGGNTLGSMINAQASSNGVGSPNPYATPTSAGTGPAVPAGPYVAGSFGRVYPMGRTFLDGANALTGFIHVDPPADQTGRSYPVGTYMRIAQANNPDWFNATTNNSGGSGVNAAQLFVVGRTTSDPQFWGAGDMTYDPGDPANGVGPNFGFASNSHAERRQNVQLFRFGIDMSIDPTQDLLVDAPLAGQQLSPTGIRYLGFYNNSDSQSQPAFQVPFGTGSTDAGVQAAIIHRIPSPGSAGALAVGLSVMRGRRRRG